jgi:hypothetical protein
MKVIRDLDNAWDRMRDPLKYLPCECGFCGTGKTFTKQYRNDKGHLIEEKEDCATICPMQDLAEHYEKKTK